MKQIKELTLRAFALVDRLTYRNPPQDKIPHPRYDLYHAPSRRYPLLLLYPMLRP